MSASQPVAGTEPTEAMLIAGARSLIDGQESRPGSSWADEARLAFKAMLAASPQAPAGHAGNRESGSGDSAERSGEAVTAPPFAEKQPLTLMEKLALEACNQVKAWAESDRKTPFPEEAHMLVDGVVMFAAQRRKGVA